MTLSLCGTRIEYKQVNAYGAGIFFVTNDHTGNIRTEDTSPSRKSRLSDLSMTYSLCLETICT